MPLPLGGISDGQESGGTVAATEATLPLAFLNDLVFTEEGTLSKVLPLVAAVKRVFFNKYGRATAAWSEIE